MDETFELPVHYNHTDLLFPAQLQAWGYSHRILVTIGKRVIIFEPDEERNYRAILSEDNSREIPDPLLIQSIASTIESLFK